METPITDALITLNNFIEFYSQTTGTRFNPAAAQRAFMTIGSALSDRILIEAGLDPAQVREDGYKFVASEFSAFKLKSALASVRESHPDIDINDIRQTEES